jgi:hypothetical protein
VHVRGAALEVEEGRVQRAQPLKPGRGGEYRMRPGSDERSVLAYSNRRPCSRDRCGMRRRPRACSSGVEGSSKSVLSPRTSAPLGARRGFHALIAAAGDVVDHAVMRFGQDHEQLASELRGEPHLPETRGLLRDHRAPTRNVPSRVPGAFLN